MKSTFFELTYLIGEFLKKRAICLKFCHLRHFFYILLSQNVHLFSHLSACLKTQLIENILE